MYVFKLTDRVSNIPSNLLRGCQSGTWSAGQEDIRRTSANLQREDTNKNKAKIEEGKTKKQITEIIYRETSREPINQTDAWCIHARAHHKEGHSLERVDILPPASYPMPSPNCNHLAFAPKGIASTTTPSSQGSPASLPVQATPLVRNRRLLVYSPLHSIQ